VAVASIFCLVFFVCDFFLLWQIQLALPVVTHHAAAAPCRDGGGKRAWPGLSKGISSIPAWRSCRMVRNPSTGLSVCVLRDQHTPLSLKQSHSACDTTVEITQCTQRSIQ
jgi:hypothetical protein